jgi:hypothetical protein
MNVLTTSGIMSIKSGSDIDIRSATAMLLKSETTLTETVASSMSVTVGGTYTGSITGTYTETITGIAGIKYNADATFHYVDAFKEKIDGDTFVDKAGGFVDHAHPLPSARSSGTDAVDAL